MIDGDDVEMLMELTHPDKVSEKNCLEEAIDSILKKKRN